MADSISDAKNTLRSYFAEKGDDGDQRSWLELSKDSTRDPLTGAYNRKYLMDEIAKIKPEDNIVIAMADIDHFKKINDTYGHNVGDQALKHFVNIVKGSIRSDGSEPDILARYGGEEFVLLLKNYGSREVIEKRLQQLCTEIEATPVDRRQKHETNIPMTASFGYVFSDGKTSAEDLLIKADQALYKAKQTGRNRVVMAQSL